MTAALNPGHASPGLWLLAWRRLRADRLAMVALAVVAAFLLMLVLSASGLIVADWEDEVAVSYAPPAFVGAGAYPERVLPFHEEGGSQMCGDKGSAIQQPLGDPMLPGGIAGGFASR